MKKTVFIGFLLISLGLFPTKFFAQQPSATYQPTAESIKNAIDFLASDALQGRKTGTVGIEKAAEYIEQIFKKAGIKPYFETYRDNFMVGKIHAFNVLGYIEGSDPELKNQLVILGAHYDHIGIIDPISGDSIANGADDNASGTVAILELAKHFASLKPKRSMVFALFSAEETGLLGSKHLAQKLQQEDASIYLMLNFEMIGIPLENKTYLAYLTGYDQSNFATTFNEYAKKEVFGFLPTAKKYHLFYRSDNYPFFKTFGIPAQTLSTFDFTNFPYYHHVDDEVTLMDVNHMQNLILAVIPGIKKIANTPEKEIKMILRKNGE